MKLSFIEPRAELKPFIQYFVVFESPIGMPASGTHLVAPDSCPRLIITIENSITSICGREISASVTEFPRSDETPSLGALLTQSPLPHLPREVRSCPGSQS